MGIRSRRLFVPLSGGKWKVRLEKGAVRVCENIHLENGGD